MSEVNTLYDCGKNFAVSLCSRASNAGINCCGECQGAIIVHEVYDNGAAARDGRLMPGDQILEVYIVM